MTLIQKTKKNRKTMGKMFEDKIRSFFSKKPRFVDGCCEQETCCKPYGNCGYTLLYRVNTGTFGQYIEIERFDTIGALNLTPGDYIEIYLRADIGDITVSSITKSGDLIADWIIPGLIPFTVTESSVVMVGRFTVSVDDAPGSYLPVLTVDTSCGLAETTLDLTVENASYCLYDIFYEVIDTNGNVTIESGMITPIVTPTFPLVNNLTVGETYVLYVYLVPAVNNIQITNTSFAGDITATVYPAFPVVAPPAVNTEAGRATLDSTVGSPKAVDVSIENSCTDFGITITYNTVVP